MTQVTPLPLGVISPVASDLRARVLAGDLAPGTWLRESTLAAQLGVSRTPVREALRTLAAEGLVVLVPRRGARVVAWTADDIDETYRLRALLEGEAAALAARRALPDQIQAMRTAQARYEASIAAAGRPEERAGCNDAFHAAVIAGSNSARLPALLAVIASPPLTVRALGRYSEDDVRRSVLQHRDVLTAVEVGDDQLASAAMRSHLLAARYVAGAADATSAAGAHRGRSGAEPARR